jgi:mRNA interferase RelE/StbE
MADYRLTFARSARKELEALDAVLVNRIFPRIEALAKNPRPRNCHKLRGEKNLWRVRVGDYRVIYAVYEREATVDIIAVRHRSKAYE